MGYTAYVLATEFREQLLQLFPPKFSTVICHHITVQFPAKSSDPLPESANIAVVGYSSDKGIEALVVEINGTTERSDGAVFHLTLSLSKELGKKPVMSNDLLKTRGWDDVVPSISIKVTPAFLQ